MKTPFSCNAYGLLQVFNQPMKDAVVNRTDTPLWRWLCWYASWRHKCEGWPVNQVSWALGIPVSTIERMLDKAAREQDAARPRRQPEAGTERRRGAA
jgi:hypothetical protein